MADKINNPIIDTLLETGFDYNKAKEPLVAEKPRLAAPATPMTVKIRIDDIQPYDQNPRRAPNEKFQEIKDSIRDVGLEQQISITKRPNDDYYIVRSGGNTRLKALKELYLETNDLKFGMIECKFVPYTNELDLLSLHVMENEQRAAMLFIDVALAAQKLKEMIEEEQGKTLSLRDLEKALSIRHCGIKYSNLSYYLYGAEIADLLPKAFSRGLGRSKIESLKKLEGHVKQWAKEKNKDVNQAIQYFRSIIKEKDAEFFSVDDVERKMLERLADEFHEKYNDVRNAFIHLKNNVSLVNYNDENQFGSQMPGVNAQVNVSLPHINTHPFVPLEIQKINSESTHSTHHIADANAVTPLMTQDIIFSNSVDIENKGVNSQGAERNKLRHQLRDYFNFIIGKIHHFDQAFTLSNDNYIITSTHEAKMIISVYDADEAGVWYALHTRAEMIRIIVDGHKDRPHSRKELSNLLSKDFLTRNEHLEAIIPNLFITHISNILPDHIRQAYCSITKPEVIEIFNFLPSLDQKLKAYLSHFS